MKEEITNWTQNLESLYTREELEDLVKKRILERVRFENKDYYIKEGTKTWFLQFKKELNIFNFKDMRNCREEAKLQQTKEIIKLINDWWKPKFEIESIITIDEDEILELKTKIEGGKE